MVKYDYTYSLASNQGDSTKAAAQYIILHETGNANNVGKDSARNEAIYMKGHWQSAYTHAIAGWDVVYVIGEPGYISYGAGTVANSRSPFQIELARYSDKSLALKAYKNWIDAAREYAKKYGIPLTLDGIGNGTKTHKWVSDNIWGDHQDPYGYLSSIGISKSQLASDLKNGVGSSEKKEDENKYGVIRVNSHDTNVRLTHKDGRYTDTYVKHNAAYKIVDVDSKAGWLIGKDEWLPFKYSKIRIDYVKGYGVLAIDDKGKGIPDTNKKFITGSEWKAFGGFVKDGVWRIVVSKNVYINGKYTG